MREDSTTTTPKRSSQAQERVSSWFCGRTGEGPRRVSGLAGDQELDDKLVEALFLFRLKSQEFDADFLAAD